MYSTCTYLGWGIRHTQYRAYDRGQLNRIISFHMLVSSRGVRDCQFWDERDLCDGIEDSWLYHLHLSSWVP